MPNGYRDRNWRGGSERDFDRGDEAPNRGMFGYEGEGFMRGGGAGNDDDDFASRGYGRDTWGDDSTYRDRPGSFSGGGYGPGRAGTGGSGRGNRDDYEDTRGSYFTTGSVGVDPRGYRDLEAGIGRDTNQQSHRGKGPKNYQRSDERIREDVCERLAMDHDVDASEIEVTVNGGTVTLTGSVPDRRAKRLAEDISESIHGVKDVENQIRVNRA
ncbi:MAG TPA: BON domain-containing protein [Thermoanaerobaculia bacterium]|jgi:hypothetical protein